MKASGIYSASIGLRLIDRKNSLGLVFVNTLLEGNDAGAVTIDKIKATTDPILAKGLSDMWLRAKQEGPRARFDQFKLKLRRTIGFRSALIESGVLR